MLIAKMYLIVFLTTACSAVVSSKRSKLKHFQPVKRQTSDDTSIEKFPPRTLSENERETLVNLDESLSKCGIHQIDIRDLTISQFQKHFKSGKLNSTELTQCYLNRIKEMDPFLKSVIEINPDAIALAWSADYLRQIFPKRAGLMLGIPILIKDNICTTDSMETTVGAKALEYVRPKREAEVVKRLRRAGAVIIGKSNPSEWAKDGRVPSGWSDRGGQTVCPYVTDVSPSGSSSGSAVSVSANLVAVSLGTETDGSIIAPSSRNGIVGLKTTFQQVPTTGVIPLSYTRDVVGPMTRTAEDAAILWGVISKTDSECEVHIGSFPYKNISVGVIRDKFWDLLEDEYVLEMLTALEDCLNKLNSSGLAAVIDPIESPVEPPEIDDADVHLVCSHEFKHSINMYLKNDVEHCEPYFGKNITSLHDIIKYNEEHSLAYDQGALRMSNQTDGLRNVSYLNAKERISEASTSFLQSIFEKYDVDALATPCFPGSVKDLYSYGASAGYPSITVPVGVHDIGVPISLCLLGKMNSEPVLLKLAYLIEKVRSTPRPMPHYREYSGSSDE